MRVPWQERECVPSLVDFGEGVVLEISGRSHDFGACSALCFGEAGDCGDSLALRVRWRLRQAQAANESQVPVVTSCVAIPPRLPHSLRSQLWLPWKKRERAGTHRGDSQGPTFSRSFINQNRPCHKKHGPFPQKYDFAKRKILLA